MKHLLSGMAVAAVLIASAVSWPREGIAEQLAAAAMPDANTASATPPMHRRAQRHAVKRSGAGGQMRAGSSGSTMANQLNQQELSRLQSGGAMPPAAPSQSPAPASAPSPGAQLQAPGAQLQGPRASSGR